MRAERACTASSTVPPSSGAFLRASTSAGFCSIATRRILSASAWKSSLLATKSVSQFSSTIVPPSRSEEHTSELQSRENLVCRLLLEKKKRKGSHGHVRLVET